jgi:hypothetical protein
MRESFENSPKGRGVVSTMASPLVIRGRTPTLRIALVVYMPLLDAWDRSFSDGKDLLPSGSIEKG